MGTPSERPAACPACGSARVAELRYGLPQFTPELERDLDAGCVVRGGCVVFDDSCQWRCLECRHGWGRLTWLRPPEMPPV